jgi:hypothetical protein
MKVSMAFFEAKAAAVASALTLLVLTISIHSALSQENAVTNPARPVTPSVATAPVPPATTAPAAEPPPSASAVMPPPQAENSGESIPAANAASDRQSASSAGELPQDLSAWGMFLHAEPNSEGCHDRTRSRLLSDLGDLAG